MAANAAELIELLFSILLPPIGVFLRRGCGVDLIINILLTFLGYIPGKLDYSFNITRHHDSKTKFDNCAFSTYRGYPRNMDYLFQSTRHQRSFAKCLK